MRHLRIVLTALAFLAPSAAHAADGLLGELSVCYSDSGQTLGTGLPRKPLMTFYGNRDSNEVLSARYTPVRAPQINYKATGHIHQAMNRASHAEGQDSPAPHIYRGFTLTYLEPKSWVSFRADLKIFVAGQDGAIPVKVECFDQDTAPEVIEPARRYYAVGESSHLVGGWAATPDLPEGLKPAADKNAAAKCAESSVAGTSSVAVRESDYLVTYQPIGNGAYHVAVVSAHYRCSPAAR